MFSCSPPTFPNCAINLVQKVLIFVCVDIIPENVYNFRFAVVPMLMSCLLM